MVLPVEVLTVQAEPLALSSELPGRIEPVRVAEVRARVAGIVVRKRFEEGADVKAGDLLFQIDPAPLKAAVSRAEGELARNRAVLFEAQARVRRYEPLVKIQAVSQQDFDTATADLRSAEAATRSAQADLETARLNLGYASVTAPISGRIGRALVTEGALVGQGEATLMARIQQLDPIYADFTQTAAEALRLRDALKKGTLAAGDSQALTLRVEGTPYERQGALQFADVDVPAGDIGVGAREIGYLFGQYKRLSNQFTSVLTGKGLSYGGSLIRPEATGFGCVYFAQEMLKDRGRGFDGQRVAISGSGNVAQYAARKVMEMGGKVISLSDSEGTLYAEAGLSDEQWEYLMELKNVRRGRIREMAEQFSLQFLEGRRPWGLACDIALPCATQNELDAEDARRLLANGCVCVAEGANMPSTLEAVDLFLEAGILYAPGKASNAGGVAVSGLEMSQNAMRLRWSEGEVDTKLHGIMQSIHHACLLYGEEQGRVNYVKGANIAGFVKVADAMLAQGVV